MRERLRLIGGDPPPGEIATSECIGPVAGMAAQAFHPNRNAISTGTFRGSVFAPTAARAPRPATPARSHAAEVRWGLPRFWAGHRIPRPTRRSSQRGSPVWCSTAMYSTAGRLTGAPCSCGPATRLIGPRAVPELRETFVLTERIFPPPQGQSACRPRKRSSTWRCRA